MANKYGSWVSRFVVASLIFALSFAGAIFSPNPAGAATLNFTNWITYLGNYGGDAQTDLMCPNGQAAVGVVSGGNYVIGIRCAAVNADGSVSSTTTDRVWGSGGTWALCPTGKVARAITANFGGSFPTSAGLKCVTPPGGTDTPVLVGLTSWGAERDCGAGKFLSRLLVQRGGWMDGYTPGCSTAVGFNERPVVTATTAPSGAAQIGSTLTSAVSFSGAPTPTYTYQWQRSSNGTDGWEDLVNATSSTYAPTIADAGRYLRSVVVATNASGSATGTSASTTILRLATLSAPDLQAASDSGTSTTDNLTKDSTPTFDLSGLTVGTDVLVTATQAGQTSQTCQILNVTASTASCTFVEGFPTAGAWAFTVTQSTSQATSTASAATTVTFDTTGPQITAVTMTPVLTKLTTIAVEVTFNETISNVAGEIDSSKITLSGISTGWTISGLTRKTTNDKVAQFNITNSATTIINGQINIDLADGFTRDQHGQLSSASIEAQRLSGVFDNTKPTAVISGEPELPTQKGTDANPLRLTLGFSEPIRGLVGGAATLAASDFTFSGTGFNGCTANPVSSATATSGGVYEIAVDIKGCTASGTFTIALEANAVDDLTDTTGNTGPIANVVSRSITRDLVAPKITTVTKSLTNGEVTTVTYEVTFDEAINASSFTSDKVTATQSGATSAWQVSAAPTRVGETNTWSFAISNATPVNGTVSVALANTITDLAGNALVVTMPTISSVNASQAQIYVAPVLNLGSLNTAGTGSTVIAPNLTLDGRGGTIYGMRIELTDPQPGDALAFTASNNVTKDARSTSSVLYLLSTTATAAQWQAALRTVTLSATGSTADRNYEFHIKPFEGYSYVNGHVYQQADYGVASTPFASLKSAANKATLGDNQGYLATLTSAEETAEFAVLTNLTGYSVHAAQKTVGTTTANVGTEIVKFFDGPEQGQTTTYTPWYSGQPDVASSMCILVYAQNHGVTVAGKWNDIGCSESYSQRYIVEFGGFEGDESFTQVLSATQLADTAAPTVESIDAPSGSANLGTTAKPLVLTLRFSEPFKNLAAADILKSGAIAGCVVGTPSASTDTIAPYESTVQVTGCTASGEVTFTLAANSVNDLAGDTGNPGPATATTLATFIRDFTAPTVAISSSVQGTTVTYEYTFSEPVLDFTADDLTATFTGIGGAAGWSVAGPSLKDGTSSTYLVTYERETETAGDLSVSLAALSVSDAAGNQLAANATSAVSLAYLPTFSLGALHGSRNATALSPDFTLDAKGATLAGTRIRITNAQSGDTLAFVNNNSSLYGSIQSLTTTNGVFELTYSGAVPTEAHWQAAIRAIQYSNASNTSTSAERNIEVHLKPRLNSAAIYLYDTQHFYEPVANVVTNAVALAESESKTLAGLQGYLMTDVIEAEHNYLLGTSTNYWVSGYEYSDGFKYNTGPNSGNPVNASFWNPAEPNAATNEPCIVSIDEGYANYGWADYGCTATFKYVIEYGGMPGEAPRSMIANSTMAPDLEAPRISSITALTEDGFYIAGDSIRVKIIFSEPVEVTGSPELNLVFASGSQPAGCEIGETAFELLCEYVIAQGDTASDLDYSSTTALYVVGGEIKDASGNSAVLTLPAPGTPGSLSLGSDIEIDGNYLELNFSADSSTSTTAEMTFTLSSTLPIDCSSLSIVNGVDFDLVNVSAITSILAADDDLSCIIHATSTVAAANYGTSALNIAESFAINDTQVTPVAHTWVVSGNTQVSVVIEAAEGEGSVDFLTLPGESVDELDLIAPDEFFGSLSMSSRAALEALGIVREPAGVVLTGSAASADFSALTRTSARIDAARTKQLTTGEKLSMQISVSADIAADYVAVAYLKRDGNWIYLGTKDFDDANSVESAALVFAQPGSYKARMIVVERGTVLSTSVSGSAASASIKTKEFTAAAITDADLPTGIQKLDLDIAVLGNPVTVIVPTPSPSPTPSATPTPTPTRSPSPTPSATSSPTPTYSPSPTPSVAPTPSPSGQPTESPAPTAEPTAEPSPEPSESVIALPEPSEEPEQPAPGEPVANPAIGATGDDSDPPTPFDPLATPEGVAAVTKTAVTALTVVSSVAAAAAAAAAGAAGAGAGASSGGSGGSANSSSNSNAAEVAEASEASDSGEGEVAELEVALDQLELKHRGWGDGLAMFALPFMTFFDHRSNRWATKIARVSPLISKVITDGAYIRAALGSISLLLPTIATALAVISIGINQVNNPGLVITPPWMLLLAIAVLGVFDALAGFVAGIVFVVGTIAVTLINDPEAMGMSAVRLLMGVMVVVIGPAMLTTAFRQLRKEPESGHHYWWERLVDTAVAPFMAGWSVAAMISSLPALAGLTLPVANHVLDFALAIAVAALLRVWLEEGTARLFPARLDAINPTEIPEPGLLQKIIVLIIKYGIWVTIGGALIGPSWQVWVGSALFLFPTILGWFSDRFPNSPRLWKLLPSGIPGLVTSLVVASGTSMAVAAIFGVVPTLAAWSFVLIPLPMLVLSLLGLFGRHGANEDDEKPAKAHIWVYRIGGLVMFAITLKLTGII